MRKRFLAFKRRRRARTRRGKPRKGGGTRGGMRTRMSGGAAIAAIFDAAEDATTIRGDEKAADRLVRKLEASFNAIESASDDADKTPREAKAAMREDVRDIKANVSALTDLASKNDDTVTAKCDTFVARLMRAMSETDTQATVNVLAREMSDAKDKLDEVLKTMDTIHKKLESSKLVSDKQLDTLAREIKKIRDDVLPIVSIPKSELHKIVENSKKDMQEQRGGDFSELFSNGVSKMTSDTLEIFRGILNVVMYLIGGVFLLGVIFVMGEAVVHTDELLFTHYDSTNIWVSVVQYTAMTLLTVLSAALIKLLETVYSSCTVDIASTSASTWRPYR